MKRRTTISNIPLKLNHPYCKQLMILEDQHQQTVANSTRLRQNSTILSIHSHQPRAPTHGWNSYRNMRQIPHKRNTVDHLQRNQNWWTITRWTAATDHLQLRRETQLLSVYSEDEHWITSNETWQVTTSDGKEVSRVDKHRVMGFEG